MPRPKSELTKSGRTIGVRVTQSEYEEFVRLGGGKWLRKQLSTSLGCKSKYEQTAKTLSQ